MEPVDIVSQLASFIAALRDAGGGQRGATRELSIAITKLEEAQMWLEYGILRQEAGSP